MPNELGLVDWNCDGAPDDPDVHANITGTTLVDSGDPDVCWAPAPLADEILEDSDDWGNLELYHRKFFGQPIPTDGLPWVDCAPPPQ